MRKFMIALFVICLAACSAYPEETADKSSEPLTYNATMAIKPGTLCGANNVVLLPDPGNPNMYLTRVSIVKTTADSGYWQNVMGFTPYTAVAGVTATEFAAYCATLSAPGKNSQVTFYWDGSNCPSGHCVETQSPVITNM